MLYAHWKERKLCRSVLKDFALGEDPEQLIAGILFFWFRRWCADIEKTFFAQEHFVKADEGEDWHVTNYGRAAGSK